MKKLRAAVVGAGSFGRNHVRILSQLPDVELVGIVDIDIAKAQQLANQYNCSAFESPDNMIGSVDAVVVATPTVTHVPVASRFIENGVHVLVEKPIADSSAAGERLVHLAAERGCILQVGHLERFNPAVTALQKALTIPLFFEVHRLSVFTPRSLDIDVVLDLMIHDLDIVLSFTGQFPVEIRAAGISVLSERVDIANARLLFADGCVANLTASRVSTEQVRKLRLFQPGEYISLDYARQDATCLVIRKNEPTSEFVSQNAPPSVPLPEIGFESLNVTPGEPLQLELESFVSAVRTGSAPRVTGRQAVEALQAAESILAKIKEHADLVRETVRRRT